MNAYEIADAVISALSTTNLPVFHQFDISPVSKRRECFITVGIDELICDSESSAVVTVSLYTPSSYSGGKILSAAKNITPALVSSGLSVRSIRAKALSYDRDLDRMRYDFSVKINPEGTSSPSAEDFSVTEGLVVSADSFTVGRERSVSEIGSVSSGVFLGDGGNRLVTLTVSGTTTVPSAECAEILDRTECEGTSLCLMLGGITFPPMRLRNYLLSVKNGRTEVRLDFISENTEEGLRVSG